MNAFLRDVRETALGLEDETLKVTTKNEERYLETIMDNYDRTLRQKSSTSQRRLFKIYMLYFKWRLLTWKVFKQFLIEKILPEAPLMLEPLAAMTREEWNNYKRQDCKNLLVSIIRTVEIPENIPPIENYKEVVRRFRDGLVAGVLDVDTTLDYRRMLTYNRSIMRKDDQFVLVSSLLLDKNPGIPLKEKELIECCDLVGMSHKDYLSNREDFETKLKAKLRVLNLF
jgi:hypothetical protein